MANVRSKLRKEIDEKLKDSKLLRLLSLVEERVLRSDCYTNRLRCSNCPLNNVEQMRPAAGGA
jgi:hypothetical protein